MRYLGTLMLLASVGMLLFPSLWEGRKPAALQESPGQSTLRADDHIPAWRGPRGDKDG